MKVIALYLPQYHPIKENNEWYGEGFTEWNNVAKARPLYKGHYQPHIPADLGFYDLRLPETRRQQAKMAQDYEVDAFCYWTYWFGNGKRLLEMPLQKVYEDKEITLPFCIGWANHSWEKKSWDQNQKNELLVEQKYLGYEDYKSFFYCYLPIFKDNRYLKVGDKLFFLIYNPLDNKEQIKLFINTFDGLANKEGLNGFYFVANDSDCRNKEEILKMGFDAVYDDNTFNIHHKLSFVNKVLLMIKRKVFHLPTVFEYKDAVEYMVTKNAENEDVIPCIAPNWDHSPRSGVNNVMLKNCEPKYFKKALQKAFNANKNKKEEHKIVIIKSWNEWGEGNHLEPDCKYGKGYLQAIVEAKKEFQ